MKCALALVGLVLVVLVGLGVAARLKAGGDDRTMIRETLNQTLQGAREGKANLVLDALSKSLTVNNQDAEGNFGMVSNYIKNQKPDITVTNPNPVVSGDEATITSPVQLKTSFPIVGDKTVTMKDVVLTFKKETGRAFLFFPVPKWRLVQVQAPENAIGSLSME